VGAHGARDARALRASGLVRIAVVVEQLARPAPGGIGVWVREVTPRLAAAGFEVESVASGSVPVGALAALGGRPRRMLVPSPLAQRLWDLGLGALPRGLDAGLWLSFAGPRIASRPPAVVVVHDLIFRSHPELYTPRGARWHAGRLADALANGRRLVAVDRTVADELLRAGARPERVVVVPPGADHLPPADREAAQDALSRAGVHRPYVLALGTLEPRKNLARLVEAYARYRAGSFDPVELCVVGPKGWGGVAVPEAPGVHWLGSLPAPALAGVLVGAQALVYVSLVEGFGLPVVEALAAAVPVVVSVRVPAARYGGIAVDPEDTAAIAEGLARVLEDERERAALVTQGLLAVEQLSWDRSAARLAELVREAADG